MKNQFLSFFLSLSFVFSVSAQTKESQKIDEFGRIPCGDFLSRMNTIFTKIEETPDSKIYVIYYGGRYRRTSGWNKKINDYQVTKLDYPHREDGLSWAKSIPLYLTTEAGFSTTSQNLLKNKVILIDGGFRENIEVEIWLVSKDADLPKPTPTIDEKDIKFRKDRAYRTPIFTKCYDGL